MLCDNCHERKAHVFLTEMIEGIMNQRYLCTECYPGCRRVAERVPAIATLPAICRYCGSDALAFGPGTPERTRQNGGAMCKMCTAEMHRFANENFPQLEDGSLFSKPERRVDFQAMAAELESIYAEIDLYMKKWGAKKGPS